MKFNSCNNLLFIILFLATSASVAQSSNRSVVRFETCDQMSKDPRCWEGKDNTSNPRPSPCSSRYTCSVIKSVYLNSSGLYVCKDNNDNIFSCHKLVQEYGIELKVKVTTLYIDRCHMPERCGFRACLPISSFASIDQTCL